eukprot:SAG22_NODE_3167_length_1885_cov_2.585666_2_plen_297_part_00
MASMVHAPRPTGQPCDTLGLRAELNRTFENNPKKEQYWNGMRRFFMGKLSQKELTDIVRHTLGPHVARHNQFIRGIYINAEHAAMPLEALATKTAAGGKKKAAASAKAAAAAAAAMASRERDASRDAHGDHSGRDSAQYGDHLAHAPKTAPRKQPKLQSFADPWLVSHPLLGGGPPKMKSKLAGKITDLLVDEQSFFAMHNRCVAGKTTILNGACCWPLSNCAFIPPLKRAPLCVLLCFGPHRMVQLAVPTAVDAVSPDAVVLMMHALGAYLKTVVHGIPDVPKPLRSLRNQVRAE